MTSENDVPLGDGSRRYYEQLFGTRIRQVNKGGGAPRGEGGSSRGPGRAGCGVLIAVFVLIRIFLAVFHNHPSTVPSLPRFEVGVSQQPKDGGAPRQGGKRFVGGGEHD